MKDTMIFGLSNGKKLAARIKKELGISCADPVVSKFADGELLVTIKETVRERNVYLVQSTSSPVNDSLMELLIAADACKRASARNIVAVIPYFGYARQDRKAKSRQPITGKLVATLLEKAGVTKVITFDLHSQQTQGFFDIPVDDLRALNILGKSITSKYKSKVWTVVAPDHGGSKRARDLANRIGCDIALIDKRRPKDNEVVIEHIIGDVNGRDCIIIDDMIDTGGTICAAARTCMDKGAKSVIIAASHGVFSGEALNRLKENPAKEVMVTNTIDSENDIDKITRVDIGSFLSKVINANEKHNSISEVYKILDK